MKKLAGLLAFAVALACAILITQYYSSSKKTPQAPPPPVMPPVSAPPAAPPTSTAAPVTFKPQLITLDLASKKASATLTLERGPAASSAPERVWVWAYFFTQESPGRYCSGEPVEVKKPFDSGAHARVTIELPVSGCPTPRTPSTTFYARVNVSTESAFAARLTEQRISYDISQATPVVTLKGAGK
jgi:hypothetical protein